MVTMITGFKVKCIEEKAQGIVEYALLVAAIVVIAGLVLVNNESFGSYSYALGKLFKVLGALISGTSGIGS